MVTSNKQVNCFTAAALQLCSTSNVNENLQQLTTIISTIDDGGDIVILPENFAQMGKNEDVKNIAEHKNAGPIQEKIAGLAKKHAIWIVAGTIPIYADTTDKVYTSCVVFDAQGRMVHMYNKRHLFDVDLPNGECYRESDSYAYGEIDQSCYFESPWGLIGLSVCYDLRFPEHYRQMPDDIIMHCVTAAFTSQTGRAHWEVLLRARAIENQCFVIAARQAGQHENGRETWGHSSIIDPWGTIINCLPKGAGLCTAIIDLDAMNKIRKTLPCLQHKRIHK